MTRMLLKMAMRNVFRQRRRTLLTLMVLIFGSSGLITIGGFFDNIMDANREHSIHGHTGHLQINARGFRKMGVSDPFGYLISNVEETRKLVQSSPNVLFLVPRLQFGGMAVTDNASQSVVVQGVDPNQERRMGGFQYRNVRRPSIHIASGNDLDASVPSGAVLGQGLMNALKLNPKDKVTLITTRERGAIDGDTYEVRGSFETAFKDFDDRALKIDIRSAQRLLGVPDKVHTLLVILDQTEETEKVKEYLTHLFHKERLDLEIHTWREVSQFYESSRRLLNKVYTTIFAIVGVVVFFSIANMINMSLFERTREFGTMMALGNTRLLIGLTVVCEVAILGLIGAALGTAFGSGIGMIISSIRIEMPSPQSTNSYYAAVSLSFPLLARVFMMVFISALFASLVPAWRVCRLRIVQALEFV